MNLPVLQSYFNPHEREARDGTCDGCGEVHRNILIHTSVKLVTRYIRRNPTFRVDFNPHEREARDVYSTTTSLKHRHFNPHEREARD